MQKMTKDKIIYRRLQWAALIICIVLASVLVVTNVNRRASLKKSEELRKLYDEKVAYESESYEKLEAPSSEPHKVQERFEPLLKINPETIGWIKAGTLADEPVVYRDNDYYLHYDFEGQKNSSGTVFMDVENSRWEHDKYLILYGHYMKNGARFGNLIKYRNIEDLKKNLIVKWDAIYSIEPEEYVVFSVFDASMLENDKAFFYLRRFEELRTVEGEVQNLIEELKKRSIFDIPVEVNANDKIFVLVTCSYGYRDGRLLVFCRKVRPDEDVDLIIKAVEEKTAVNSAE